jgi:hypothetical protein
MNEEEINLIKEDLKLSDSYFISCSNKLLESEKKIDELEQKIIDIQEEMSDIDYLKNQITFLNSVLSKTDALWAQSQEKERRWEEVATKLYSVALHLEEIAKSRCNIVVVGPGLYTEAVESIKEYEKLQND